MKKLLLISALTAIAPVGTLLAGGFCMQSCATAKAVATAAVKIAVDTCAELADAGVDPGWVALVCATVDATAPEVEVLISSLEWSAMKQAYLAQHGSLPAGMSMP